MGLSPSAVSVCNPYTAVTINCISVSTPPDGTRTSATVYTVIETAKANGLNPEKNSSHLPTVLPECFAKDPKSAVDDLPPGVE